MCNNCNNNNYKDNCDCCCEIKIGPRGPPGPRGIQGPPFNLTGFGPTGAVLFYDGISSITGNSNFIYNTPINTIYVGNNNIQGVGGQIGFLTTSIAIGQNDSLTIQGNNAISIGTNAGQTSQLDSAVAIGQEAGQTSQGQFAVAMGYQAGQYNQIDNAVAIGASAGNTAQGAAAVAMGYQAGYDTQGNNAIAMGYQAGYDTQGNNAIAIGTQSGNNTQGDNAVAIGNSAGQYNQLLYAIAIGAFAGNTGQESGAVAIGPEAGYDTQGNNAIAIGSSAGQYSQLDGAVAIGAFAGNTGQGTTAVAMGTNAGYDNQGTSAVAIGNISGQHSQGESAVAIGKEAGNTGQGQFAVAMGINAGYDNQGTSAVAIGKEAGNTGQGQFAVAMGTNAGYYTQGESAVAIGQEAGYIGQGANSIAIGKSAGKINQPPNTIVLNATGVEINGDESIITNIPEGQTGAFFVAPIRSNIPASNQMLYYDNSTCEITFGAAASGPTGAIQFTDGAGRLTYDPSFTFLSNVYELASGTIFSPSFGTSIFGSLTNFTTDLSLGYQLTTINNSNIGIITQIISDVSLKIDASYSAFNPTQFYKSIPSSGKEVNISCNLNINSLSINGSKGVSGQVLTTNGSNSFWSNNVGATGAGPTGPSSIPSAFYGSPIPISPTITLSNNGPTGTSLGSTTITSGVTGYVWGTATASFNNNGNSEYGLKMYLVVDGTRGNPTSGVIVKETSGVTGYLNMTTHQRTSAMIGPTASTIQAFAYTDISSASHVTCIHCDIFGLGNLS